MNEKRMTLGMDWDGEENLDGWLCSEKFDGCRAYWDGTALWTRQGNRIPAPAAFIAALPAGLHMDGEIWAGRGRFVSAMNAVVHGVWTPEIRFVVFDAPGIPGNQSERMAVAMRAIAGNTVAIDADVSPVADEAEIWARLAAVKSVGGEGIMLRSPREARYQPGRTPALVKIKNENQRR